LEYPWGRVHSAFHVLQTCVANRGAVKRQLREIGEPHLLDSPVLVESNRSSLLLISAIDASSLHPAQSSALECQRQTATEQAESMPFVISSPGSLTESVADQR